MIFEDRQRLVGAGHTTLYDYENKRPNSKRLMWGMSVAIICHVIGFSALYYYKSPLVMPDQTPIDKTIDSAIITLTPKPIEQPKTVAHPPLIHKPVILITPPKDDVIDVAKTQNTDTKGAQTLPTGLTGTSSSAVSTSSAEAGGGGASDIMVEARWAKFPDGTALSSYYPQKALDAEREGRATVDCIISDAEGHVHCSLLSETPANYGFGKATIKMIEDIGRVDMTKGAAAIGKHLHQGVVWKLPD